MSISWRKGPCQAIQLPDDDDVALAGVVEELHQLRPLGLGTRGLLLIDAGALGALERIHLQMGFLGIGGDARLANFHGAQTRKNCSLCTISIAP